MRPLWPISGSGQDAIQEGRRQVMNDRNDRAASRVFAAIARLTGGAYARFDVSAPASLLELLRGAAGGREAMLRLAGVSHAVKGLIAAMGGER